ncbi:double-stranded RNA-specific editase 1-like isoform X1 [Asterias rubens]|uniref:double-stranded RNA-specific editase 1-like isoform X1 n=1 Tax=Asterias rubens TaxID=7604 RepID=UPI0014558B9D|nr:double-stranded RNA-specific editase 1-like isoform X1 [Asterias rubens]
MANCKTAVSILQEHCAQLGMTPIYNTISQEGLSHQPKFTISCTAGPTVGTGDGVSKKCAKQAAAEAVLQQWEVEIPKIDSAKAESVDNHNPVGELQELVTFLGWRKPEYNEIEETGPPHDRSFVVSVTVGKFEEKGTDKSKRLAKRSAARAMLETIKALPPDTDPGIEPGTTKPKKKAAPASSKTSACTLQNATGDNITRLCSHPLDFQDSQSCHILQLVAEEQQFQLRYIELKERSLKNLLQCLVELKTSPIAVCQGTGQTEDEARSNAARNALYYIKTMACKQNNHDPTEVKDDFEPPSHKNPVQMLNEMNIAPLAFVVDSRDGPPHDPVYQLSVIVEGKSFSTRSRKKQTAKEELARKALLDVFGIVSTSNGRPSIALKPTPSDCYSIWPGKEYSWADHIQNIIEQKLREVTFHAGQMRYVKYKVLSGIVQTSGTIESSKVICIATGSKCPLANDPDTKGKVLYDCHAEVIAHRCLKRYLLDQLKKHQNDPTSSVFVGGSSGMLQLKEGVQFHLYISCPPCGDAASFIKDASKKKTGDTHPHRGARGILRAKIKQGESTIPLTGKALTAPERLFAMTCSDKVASWNVLGVQGALLSKIIAPVYLSSVVLGMQCHYDHLPRALYGRLTDLPTLPRGFILNKPLMVGTTKPSLYLFGISPSSKSPSFGINWIEGNKDIEVITTETGLTKDGVASCVSKKEIFNTYLSIMENSHSRQRATDSPQKDQKRGSGSRKSKQGKKNVVPQPEPKGPRTYKEEKKTADAYQQCKVIMKATFLSEGLGRWLVKPTTCDEFFSDS